MKEIPERTKKRFVLLLELLERVEEKNITSVELEKLTGFSSAVIRKDISYLNLILGKSNGYNVIQLKKALEDTINASGKKQKCCIVGLGRFGQTLLENTELENTNYTLVAGFDSNVNRTEVLHSVFPLHPTTMLEKVIGKEEITFAILCVPPKEAQKVTDMLCKAGIKAIVNYTPCLLSVPKNVKVENVSLLTALKTLSL